MLLKEFFVFPFPNFLIVDVNEIINPGRFIISSEFLIKIYFIFGMKDNNNNYKPICNRLDFNYNDKQIDFALSPADQYFLS